VWDLEVEMTLVAILVVVLGYLAWTRYLNLQETALLLANQDNWRAVLEARHRSRGRSGLLAGILFMLLGGLVLALLAWRASASAPPRGAVIALGALIPSIWLVVMGGVLVVAYALWARPREDLTLASEGELWSIRSGLLAGVALTLFGGLMLAMASVLPIEWGFLAIGVFVTSVGLVLVVLHTIWLRRRPDGRDAGEGKKSSGAEEGQ
jgi:hypothetical protein